MPMWPSKSIYIGMLPSELAHLLVLRAGMPVALEVAAALEVANVAGPLARPPSELANLLVRDADILRTLELAAFIFVDVAGRRPLARQRGLRYKTFHMAVAVFLADDPVACWTLVLHLDLWRDTHLDERQRLETPT